jgi:hypothetical protein
MRQLTYVLAKFILLQPIRDRNLEKFDRNPNGLQVFYDNNGAVYLIRSSDKEISQFLGGARALRPG